MAPTRTNHLFKRAKPLSSMRQEPVLEKYNYAIMMGARGSIVFVCGTDYLSQKKKGRGLFTCGRDLFRISMKIDLHVWSSIAGYGSRKRCWGGGGGTKSVGYLEWWFARISNLFPRFLSSMSSFSGDL